MLIAGRTLDDIEKLFQNVSFVVFNYDRCLEGFLMQAVTGYYHVSTEVARTLIAGINIVHPYGKVGDLPWQGGVSVPFGGGDGLNLLEIAREIRTFTETVDTGVAAKIKSMVREADTIAFLGFGFLEQNMSLLSPGGGGRATRVFASTYSVSPTDVDIISHEITKLIAKPRFNNSMPEDFQNGAYHSFLENATCVKLLNSHSHRLTKG